MRDARERMHIANERYRIRQLELDKLPRCVECGKPVEKEGETCEYCLFKRASEQERIAEEYLSILYS